MLTHKLGKSIIVSATRTVIAASRLRTIPDTANALSSRCRPAPSWGSARKSAAQSIACIGADCGFGHAASERQPTNSVTSHDVTFESYTQPYRVHRRLDLVLGPTHRDRRPKRGQMLYFHTNNFAFFVLSSPQNVASLFNQDWFLERRERTPLIVSCPFSNALNHHSPWIR
jgi:hypothetical protein